MRTDSKRHAQTFRPNRCRNALLLVLAFIALPLQGEDGYRLWLRYDPIANLALRRAYTVAITEIVAPVRSSVTADAATHHAAREELATGLRGLLGVDIPTVANATREGALIIGMSNQPEIASLVREPDLRAAGDEGFILRRIVDGERHRIILVANREIGLLYGAFALLRTIATQQPIDRLDVVSAPKVQRRVLNHWDNLNRSVERGYAGQSLWEWFVLPDVINPRYQDYARANASLGINGVVLTNVNADALVLTPTYLQKVAALAQVFRPYGIRVYLTARFSAPVEIGRLKTADPRDPAVAEWWKKKAGEIYALIPDFGGFLVKANSEGQPGPQNYGRTHADGANMLADALASNGGVVFWRAFVYDSNVPDDRHKQAFNEFKPLDRTFRDNVIVQVKNGAIDFMPREPFHPLFGAMPKTPLALELQITQEYLGHAVQLAFLAPMWEECLDSDTIRPSAGATVGRIVDGSVDRHRVTAIAGVSNIGADRNWTGHPLGQANWYAFGRLAWDHTLSAEQLADEWTRLTFSSEPKVVAPIKAMLLESHETVVNYSMPLGLHHIMAEGHHFGPGPWHDKGRPDWTSVYYHRADANGIGFDRTPSGSNALNQYAPEIAQKWGDSKTCPEIFLLWFHHLPWDYSMHSGRTLWDELCLRYQGGVDDVRRWQKTWATLEGLVDEERFNHVQSLLKIQERNAREWRDACTQYFATFSKRPLPVGVEPPEHPLEYYKAVNLRYTPGNPSGR